MPHGASARNGAGKGGVVGGAVMVDIVGAEHRAGQTSAAGRFFVGGAVGSDDANGWCRRGSRESRATLCPRAPTPPPS